jgi:hypothetical protein
MPRNDSLVAARVLSAPWDHPYFSRTLYQLVLATVQMILPWSRPMNACTLLYDFGLPETSNDFHCPFPTPPPPLTYPTKGNPPTNPSAGMQATTWTPSPASPYESWVPWSCSPGVSHVLLVPPWWCRHLWRRSRRPGRRSLGSRARGADSRTICLSDSYFLGKLPNIPRGGIIRLCGG